MNQRPSIHADLDLATMRMRRLARAVGAGVHDAEDAAQEAWCRALWAGQDIRDTDRWLDGVVRNVSREMRRSEGRRRRRETRAAVDENLGGGESLDPEAVTNQRLVEAVRALRQPYRAALVVCYLLGLPSKEAAEALGVPASTLRSRTKRGLEMLRRDLADEPSRRRGAWSFLVGLAPGRSIIHWGFGVSKFKWVGGTVLLLLLCAFAVFFVSDWQPGTDPEAGSSGAGLPAEEAEADDPGLEGIGAVAGSGHVEPDPVVVGRAPSWRGRVVFAKDGKPAPGVRIGVGTTHVRTDADGHFRFEDVTTDVVEAWVYNSPSVVAPGPVRCRVTGDPTVITVSRSSQIEGVLHVPAFIAPTVWLVSAAWAQRGAIRAGVESAIVMADGTFVLRGVPAGVPLRVSAGVSATGLLAHMRAGGQIPSLGFTPPWRMDATIQAPARELVLRADAPVQVHVRVSGVPDAGGVVIAWRERDGRPEPIRNHAYTLRRNAAGRYSAEVESAGTFRVAYSPVATRGPAAYRLLYELGRVVRLAAGPELIIEAPDRVLDQASLDRAFGRIGFAVSLRRERPGPSAAPGVAAPAWARAWMRAVDAWWIHGHAPDGRYFLAKADAAGRFQSTLSAGHSISGNLVDLDGTPLAGPGLLRVYDHRLSRTYAIKADGSFSATGLPPGVYSLRAKPRDVRGVAVAREVSTSTGRSIKLQLSGP